MLLVLQYEHLGSNVFRRLIEGDCNAVKICCPGEMEILADVYNCPQCFYLQLKARKISGTFRIQFPLPRHNMFQIFQGVDAEKSMFQRITGIPLNLKQRGKRLRTDEVFQY